MKHSQNWALLDRLKDVMIKRVYVQAMIGKVMPFQKLSNENWLHQQTCRKLMQIRLKVVAAQTSHRPQNHQIITTKMKRLTLTEPKIIKSRMVSFSLLLLPMLRYREVKMLDMNFSDKFNSQD